MSDNLPRHDDGSLRAFTDVGGYPIFYLDGDNSTLCPGCANKCDQDKDEIDQFKPVAAGVNDEDPSLYCDDCSKRIPSAYKEDEVEQRKRI